MRNGKIDYYPDAEQAPTFSQMPGLETTVLTGLTGLTGGEMMMALNATLPGETVPMHTHPHEQIGVIYAGRGMLRIGEEEREVKKGDFFCIPSNVPHGDTCLGDESFVMLDVFHPVRETFIERIAGKEPV